MFLRWKYKNEIFLLAVEANGSGLKMLARSSGAVFIAPLAERDLNRPNPIIASPFTLPPPPRSPGSVHKGSGARPGNRSALEGYPSPSVGSGRTLRSSAEDTSWRRYPFASEGSLIPAP